MNPRLDNAIFNHSTSCSTSLLCYTFSNLFPLHYLLLSLFHWWYSPSSSSSSPPHGSARSRLIFCPPVPPPLPAPACYRRNRSGLLCPSCCSPSHFHTWLLTHQYWSVNNSIALSSDSQSCPKSAEPRATVHQTRGVIWKYSA